MKIVTYNINGIRAANKLGLLDWIKDYNADIYCIQEVRCGEAIARKLLLDNSYQMGLFGDESSVKESEYSYIFSTTITY